MIRFCAYTTQYYQNGIMNNYEPHLRWNSQEDVEYFQAQYKDALASRIPQFKNPAYSRIVGSIGLWQQGELQGSSHEPQFGVYTFYRSLAVI